MQPQACPTMSIIPRVTFHFAALLCCPVLGIAQTQVLELPAEISIPEGVDLAQSFSLRMLVRCAGPVPGELPLLAANKAWESGAIRDYTTNNSFGVGRESGGEVGFAISVSPDGAWTWNAGDGRSRIAPSA